MRLDDEDKIAAAIGEPSLEGLSDDQLGDVVDHLHEIPEEAQLQLIKTNPELQSYALKAIAAVEDDLRSTLSASSTSSQKAFAALAEIREVIAGELEKEYISDERWRFLMDKLVENGQMAIAVNATSQQQIAQQSNTARLSKLALAAMPYIVPVVQAGVRILLTRKG